MVYFWVDVLLCVNGRIDPNGFWQAGWQGALSFEALWIGEESSLQDFGTSLVYRSSSLVKVDVGRGHITDARMAMGLVVPPEEPLAMAAGILNAPEAAREIRPILQCFELGLGIGVVIRDIGSAMGVRRDKAAHYQWVRDPPG